MVMDGDYIFGSNRAGDLASVIGEHNELAVMHNPTAGQRMDGGSGIKFNAGMSPAGCIEFFEKNGSNCFQLAAELKTAIPTRDFNMANQVTGPSNKNDPKFRV